MERGKTRAVGVNGEQRATFLGSQASTSRRRPIKCAARQNQTAIGITPGAVTEIMQVCKTCAIGVKGKHRATGSRGVV